MVLPGSGCPSPAERLRSLAHACVGHARRGCGRRPAARSRCGGQLGAHVIREPREAPDQKQPKVSKTSICSSRPVSHCGLPPCCGFAPDSTGCSRVGKAHAHRLARKNNWLRVAAPAIAGKTWRIRQFSPMARPGTMGEDGPPSSAPRRQSGHRAATGAGEPAPPAAGRERTPSAADSHPRGNRHRERAPGRGHPRRGAPRDGAVR